MSTQFNCQGLVWFYGIQFNCKKTFLFRAIQFSQAILLQLIQFCKSTDFGLFGFMAHQPLYVI